MDHPEIYDLVNSIADWFGIWSIYVSSVPPRFDDPIASNSTTRKMAVDQIREDIARLRSIVSRERKVTESARKPAQKQGLTREQKMQALLTRVQQTYDAPGALRSDGPRHDNDFADIADIRIAPTHNELMCPVPPYLPITIAEAPHHCAPESTQKILDIQFRLLREDLT